MYEGGKSQESVVGRRGKAWLEGELNGQSEVGEEDSKEDRDDGREGRVEVTGMGGADDAVIITDWSWTVELVVNCP